MVRALGLALAAGYVAAIVWVYTRQPQTVAEATGALSASVGAYRVDAQAFADGLGFFRADQFAAARLAFARADPAMQDPRTQFYVAYAFYREGWGRVHTDDALFRQGLAAADRAQALSPVPLRVEDGDLKLHTAAELRAELQAGLTTSWGDFNPLRVFAERK